MRSRVTLSIVAAAILLGAVLTTTGFTTTSENAFAYTRNQAKSDINECGNGFVPTNVGCQNIDSQIQGDENTVSITAQQQLPTPPPTETATIILSIIIECIAGQECPGLPVPPPDTIATITPGEYTVAGIAPIVPDGLDLVSFTRSEDCDSSANGPIMAGEVRKCIFTIIYEPETP